MPLNRRRRAKPSDFEGPPTGTRPAKCKHEVEKIYADCRTDWWNARIEDKGVVPPEHYAVHKKNKMSCAMKAWAVSKKKGKCE